MLVLLVESVPTEAEPSVLASAEDAVEELDPLPLPSVPLVAVVVPAPEVAVAPVPKLPVPAGSNDVQAPRRKSHTVAECRTFTGPSLAGRSPPAQGAYNCWARIPTGCAYEV